MIMVARVYAYMASSIKREAFWLVTLTKITFFLWFSFMLGIHLRTGSWFHQMRTTVSLWESHQQM